MIPHKSIDFLAGQVSLEPGNPADYGALARFHYLGRRPATWADVIVARYTADHPAAGAATAPKIIGIAVLSYPSAVHRARQRTFDLSRLGYGRRLRWVNANVRTISRVIVHPQFRALGLARALIEALCARCPTPIIESSARMGRAHPMFERAGFTRVDPVDEDEPVYYWRCCTQTALPIAPDATPRTLAS